MTTSRSTGELRSSASSLVDQVGDLVGVAADQRVLVLRAAGARADLNVLHRLEVHGDAGDGGDVRLQALDDVG